jgi:superfamily II RNA helicase
MKDENGPTDEEGGLLPVVVFSFSKKQCEANADFFLGKDLLTQREKGRVGKLLNQVRCFVMMSLLLFLF